MEKKKLSIMWKYVIFTYLLFWFLVLGVCGVAIFVFDASESTMKWLVALSSWAPTMTLLIMMKKLKPGLTIKKFYQNAFKAKLKLSTFVLSLLLIAGIFCISAIALALIQGVAVSTQLVFVPSLLLSNIFFTMIQGASGEESGWRGYLMDELEDRHGFVKGNLILGIVWAFWHLPLWFVSVSYSGLSLILYILVFIIGLVSFSMIMGSFMKKSHNLVLAFWMHFLFNFVLSFFIGSDLYLLISLAILYGISAVIITYRTQKSLIAKTV